MPAKTEISLKSQLEELVEKKVKPHKILVLCMNTNTKKQTAEELKHTGIWVQTFNDFINEFFKEKFSEQNFRQISDFCAIEIISSVGEKTLSQNKALKNLCKSKSFARELYNLFGLFKVNKLSYETLININKNAKISEEDKERFKIILDTYKNYLIISEENRLLDYKDVVIKSAEFIKQEENLKNLIQSKYDYILVDDAQNFSRIQYELLTLVVKPENIILFADTNAKTRTYLGANILKHASVQKIEKFKNKDILKRALFITEGFLDANQTDAIEYHTFADIQSEIEFIANDIQEQTEQGLKYSDFAVLIRDNSIKQTISELLKKYKLPVNTDLYNEKYQIFKQKFIRILELFENLKLLGIKTFGQNLANEISTKSKVDEQTYSLQINLFIENIIKESVQNKYILEKIIYLQQQNKDIFLTDTIYNHSELLPESEKDNVINVLDKLKTLYEKYNKNNFVEIITDLTGSGQEEDAVFKRIITKLISSAEEITRLKKDILKTTTDTQTILDILDMSAENDEDNQDCINLVTFFKAAGAEYKRVYIPSLTENYFPKKTKSTLFISSEANEILSKSIKEVNEDFEKIIFSNLDEFKDEECLLYVAMNCAKDKIILSTHEYEDKKKVIPSSFLEQLKYSDPDNVCEYDEENKKETKKDSSEEEYSDFKDIGKLPVLDADERFSFSASTINNFLSCPKQFYFSRLLNLKAERTEKKDYGIIIHSILELILKRYIQSFSKEKAVELAEIIFNAKDNEQKALDTGFKQELIDKIKELNDLEKAEMEENSFDAINNLESKGFFAIKPQDADCEKEFRFSIPEIPNIKFSGNIDVIVKNENNWSLIDYKTGRNKSKISKLFNENELSFTDENGFSESKMRQYDYQIPLYYLACLYSDNLKKYKDTLSQIGYQYVRPEYKHGGSSSDMISVGEIEQNKDKIIENIKKYVVDELYNKTEFEAISSNYCKLCSYKSICDTEEEEDND